MIQRLVMSLSSRHTFLGCKIMDWIKIKAEHISLEYSNAQLGAFLRWQLFVAQFGREPTDLEISKLIGRKDWGNLEETLRKLEVNLEEVRRKVLEDRDEVCRKREVSKQTSQRFRVKTER